MSGIEQTCAALADPTRRGVVELLRKKQRRVGELALHLAASAPAMSRHLKILRTCGLIEEDRAQRGDSRVRYFRLRREKFAELRSWLDRVEGSWTDQLDAAPAPAEGKRKR